MSKFIYSTFIILAFSLLLLQSCEKDNQDTLSPPSNNINGDPSLLFVENHNMFCCFNAKNGQLKWSKTFNASIKMTPFYSNGLVYFSTTSELIIGGLDTATKYTYAFDTLGNIKWSIPLLSGSIEVRNGIAYCFAGYTLTAVNANTGAFLWSVDCRTFAPQNGSRSIRTKAFYKDMLFLNTAYGFVALDAQAGSIKWMIDSLTSMNYKPPIINDKVYLIGLGYEYTCVLDYKTGNTIWKKKLHSNMVGMNVIGNNLIIQGTDYGQLRNHVYVYDTTSNPTLKWSRTFPENFSFGHYIKGQSSPIVKNGYLHVLKSRLYDYIEVLDLNNGNSIGEYGSTGHDRGPTSYVTVVNNYSFFSSTSDRIKFPYGPPTYDTLLGKIVCREITSNGILPNSGWVSTMHGNFRTLPCVVTTTGKCFIGGNEY